MKTEREQFYIDEAKYAAQKAADARKAGDTATAKAHATTARHMMDRANWYRKQRVKKKPNTL